MGLGLGLRLIPGFGLVGWPWATEAKMRRSGRSQKKDALMIQVMYLDCWQCFLVAAQFKRAPRGKLSLLLLVWPSVLLSCFILLLLLLVPSLMSDQPSQPSVVD